MPMNVLLKTGDTMYRIPATVVSRGDIAGVFKNPAGLYSGFSIRVPVDSLAAGVYSIGIERTDTIRHQHAVAFPGKTVSVGTADGPLPVALHTIPPTGTFQVSVENFSETVETVRITGWVGGKTDSIRDGRIVLLLQNQDSAYTVDVSTTNRPDVGAMMRQKHIGDDGKGFESTIPKDALPIGRYRVGVAIYNKEQGSVVWTNKIVRAD